MTVPVKVTISTVSQLTVTCPANKTVASSNGLAVAVIYPSRRRAGVAPIDRDRARRRQFLSGRHDGSDGDGTVQDRPDRHLRILRYRHLLGKHRRRARPTVHARRSPAPPARSMSGLAPVSRASSIVIQGLRRSASEPGRIPSGPRSRRRPVNTFVDRTAPYSTALAGPTTDSTPGGIPGYNQDIDQRHHSQSRDPQDATTRHPCVLLHVRSLDD